MEVRSGWLERPSLQCKHVTGIETLTRLVLFGLAQVHFAFVRYHCNVRTQGLNFVVLVTEPTLCGPRGLCLSTSVTGAATVIYWLKRQSWQAG